MVLMDVCKEFSFFTEPYCRMRTKTQDQGEVKGLSDTELGYKSSQLLGFAQITWIHYLGFPWEMSFVTRAVVWLRVHTQSPHQWGEQLRETSGEPLSTSQYDRMLNQSKSQWQSVLINQTLKTFSLKKKNVQSVTAWSYQLKAVENWVPQGEL